MFHGGMVDAAVALLEACDIFHLLCYGSQHYRSSAHVCPGTSSHHAHNEEPLQVQHSTNQRYSYMYIFMTLIEN